MKRAKQTSKPATCPYCGAERHGFVCPRIKSITYADGDISRVEFWPTLPPLGPNQTVIHYQTVPPQFNPQFDHRGHIIGPGMT